MSSGTKDLGDDCIDEDSYHSSASDTEGSDDIDDNDSMSGKKCRAPYSHSWGEMSYHNALVLCQEADKSQVFI